MVSDYIIGALIGALPVLFLITINYFLELRKIRLEEKRLQAKYFLEEKNKILRDLHKSIVELYYSTVSYVLGSVKIKKIEEYNEYKSKFNSFKINKDLAKVYLSEIENNKISKIFGALNSAQNNIFANLPDDLEFKEYFSNNYIENKEKIGTTDISKLNEMLRSSYEKALECLSDKLNPKL